MQKSPKQIANERIWRTVFSGNYPSRQKALLKAHANNPEFQDWLDKSGHGAGLSVGKAKKAPTVDKEAQKEREKKSLKAYGATKGTRMGSEDGSGEAIRDTIAPLTRDQHAKVQSAEREAKAAAKKAAPAAPKKPLSTSQRLSAIAAAVRKAKAKHDVPTMEPDDEGHDDLRDVHQSLHIRSGYNEEVEQLDHEAANWRRVSAMPKGSATGGKDEVNTHLAYLKAVHDHRKKFGYDTKSVRDKIERINRSGIAEEVEQVDEGKVAKALAVGATTLASERAMELKKMKKEEFEQIDEVTKKEAESALGGPVKEIPKMPPGIQKPGYRYVRNLARRAMRAGLKKEEVEQISEQDDTMEKVEMAQGQLHFICYAAEEIIEFIKKGGEVEEWYQNKLSKVHSDMESLHSYVEGEMRRTGMKEEVEQVDEKAPPGAKYERMVKHIKKGYAKGGLTDKEKSIAYATAWKAYKKNEEAEGTVAVTPKEKALAAHHGDKTKITYGDVVKARIKSAAAKAMKNK